jgi:hypothetical protein
MKIFKYQLPLSGGNIMMPHGAEILTAQIQNGTIMLWAQVYDDYEGVLEQRKFVILGTGMPVDDQIADGLWHIGTVQMGDFVWHIFENIN